MIKPPYQLPIMADVLNTPQNGYKVASTFSGGGGSCLGYCMAGYDVVWANEFVESAYTTYQLNMPNTHIDTRDIRDVTADDIMQIANVKVGELDLFDGSPPCVSFSTAGKREKLWGVETNTYGKKQTNDDLSFEYVRLLAGLMPKVFVMENVSGLVQGVSKGYFVDILQRLKSVGYRVSVKLLNASWLGVPQNRERLIFVGVRDDLGLSPVHPKPLNYQYTIRDAFNAIQNPIIDEECDIKKYKIYQSLLQLKAGEEHKKRFNLKRASFDKPSSTVSSSMGQPHFIFIGHPEQNRPFTLQEYSSVCSFPVDYQFLNYESGVSILGNSVPPVMMYHVAKTIQLHILDKLS
jgi:DNA (cytosine-5)-methyltransferase 1